MSCSRPTVPPIFAAPFSRVALPEARVVLSTLWVFVMLNYLYADVLSLMDPVLLPQWVSGHVDGLTITRPFLLAAAVMMEVPIAMVLLARLLPYRPNRWTNMIAGSFKTVAVAASLVVGRPNMHYAFFASIEMVTTVLIVALALRWEPPQATSRLDGLAP